MRTNARAADRAGEVESAAAGYEEELLRDQSLEALLGLALLYWQATDPGLLAAKNIDPNFVAKAGRRTPELLDHALRLHPESTAARFWKKYIAWADLGEPLDPEECRRLVQEAPSVLDPAMYVFVASKGQEMQVEVRELMRQCIEDGTARSRYMLSVLEGVMKRTGNR